MGVVRGRNGELLMADHRRDFFAPSSCRYDFLRAAAEEDHTDVLIFPSFLRKNSVTA
jgi:hypothetical protein